MTCLSSSTRNHAPRGGSDTVSSVANVAAFHFHMADSDPQDGQPNNSSLGVRIRSVAVRCPHWGHVHDVSMDNLHFLKGELLHFDDQIEFDGGVEGEFGCADGAAGVDARISEDITQDFAGAVGDLGLIREAG